MGPTIFMMEMKATQFILCAVWGLSLQVLGTEVEDPAFRSLQYWPTEARFQDTKDAQLWGGNDLAHRPHYMQQAMGIFERVEQEERSAANLGNTPDKAQKELDTNNCGPKAGLISNGLNYYSYEFKMPPLDTNSTEDIPRAVHLLDASKIISMHSEVLALYGSQRVLFPQNMVNPVQQEEDSPLNFYVTADETYVYLHRHGGSPVLDGSIVRVVVTTYTPKCPGKK